MYSSTFNIAHSQTPAEVPFPSPRNAATIGFAIAPCSIGFVIIAVSEHLIRSILVGEEPEMLMSELQNQFPHHAIRIIDSDDAVLIARVVDLIEHPERGVDLSLDVCGMDFQIQVRDALLHAAAGSPVNYTFLAEHIGSAQSTIAEDCEDHAEMTA